jgi:hypothetical protein
MGLGLSMGVPLGVFVRSKVTLDRPIEIDDQC